MKKQKTFIGRVVIKSNHPEKVPDFGLGKGVLSFKIISCKDKIDTVIEVNLWEVKKVKRTKK